MASTAPTTLGVLPRFYAKESTVLVLKPKSFGFGDWATVKDLQGAPVFKLRASAFNLLHRVHVSDLEGQQLFTIHKETSSTNFKAYADDPQGNKLFHFYGELSFGGMKSKVAFVNAADGRNIELQMKTGMISKTVEIRLADSNTVIASIEISKFMSTKFIIMITPNVDVSLVVAMCICLYERIKADSSGKPAEAGNSLRGGISIR